MEYLIVFCLACGIIGSFIGMKKGIVGRGFFLGALFGPLGLLFMLFMKGNRRACLYCRESIHKEAITCPRCQRELPENFSQYGPQEISIGKGIVYAISAFLLSGLLFIGTLLLLSSFYAKSESSNTSKSVPEKRITSEPAKQVAEKTTPQITQAHFNLLKSGMSYGEIARILKHRSIQISETTDSSQRSTITEQWSNDDGSYIIVVFDNIRSMPNYTGCTAKYITSSGLR
jgi:hypothetical protein